MKTTSRIFIKPTVPTYMDEMTEDLKALHVDISYVQQAIPLPYGMPTYESIYRVSAAALKDGGTLLVPK
jgi:hypothetical protein